MSDNGPLQLGLLSFSDEPGGPGGLAPVGVIGGSSSAIHQRWFILRDGQFHPASPTSGPNLDFDSDRDTDPNQQPNICVLTIVLRTGAVLAHHTERLDACINTSNMNQIASKVAEALPAVLVNHANSHGVAQVVKACSSLNGRDLYILHSDGSALISTTDNGTGHEAFLRAVDRSAERAIANKSPWRCATGVLATALIVWLIMAAKRRAGG